MQAAYGKTPSFSSAAGRNYKLAAVTSRTRQTAVPFSSAAELAKDNQSRSTASTTTRSRSRRLSGLPGDRFGVADGLNQPGDPGCRPAKGLQDTVTITNNPPPNARPVRRDAAIHLFAVGQAVRMKVGLGGSTLSSDIYHITGTLPPRGDSPQYRIRNDHERHERVITQASIEPLDMSRSGGGPTLSKQRSAMAKRQKRSNCEIRVLKKKPLPPNLQQPSATRSNSPRSPNAAKARTDGHDFKLSKSEPQL